MTWPLNSDLPVKLMMTNEGYASRRSLLLLWICLTAPILAFNADAQQSVLDEMAPQLVIKKTTMADILKKERHVHKTRKLAISNANRTFTAFIVNIFYEDAEEGCDCLFFTIVARARSTTWAASSTRPAFRSKSSPGKTTILLPSKPIATTPTTLFSTRSM
jgi:hypothetical protein